MGWTNQQTDSITVPPSAGPTTAPRIYIGPGDPFAFIAGAIASIMMYWDIDEAFMIWITKNTPTEGFFQIANTDASGIVAEYITGTYDESNGNATLTLGFVDDIDIVATTVSINGTPISTGGTTPHSYEYTTSNSGAIGAETVLLTIPSATYSAGRAYRMEVRGRLQASVANTGTIRARLGTTTGGTLFATLGGVPVTVTGATSAAGFYFEVYFKVDESDPDVTSPMVITLSANTGTDTLLAGANEPSYVVTYDVGDWSDYPFGIFL
jgi:hypothetical protein